MQYAVGRWLTHIVAVVTNDEYKSDYTWNVEDGFVYDGFTYCFDYQKNNNNRKRIQFIPPNRPHEFKVLSSLLDTLIYSKATKEIDALNINDYTEELKHLYFAKSGPSPTIEKPKIELRSLKISK